MNTIEMFVNAQSDGIFYRCPACKMLYSKEAGLVEDDDYNEQIYMEQFEGYTVDKFLSLEWIRAENCMTIKEAEEKLGVKIVL